MLEQMGLDYEVIKGDWHAYFFLMPGAEQAFARKDYSFLKRCWQGAAPEFAIPEALINRVKDTFRHEGTLERRH